MPNTDITRTQAQGHEDQSIRAPLGMYQLPGVDSSFTRAQPHSESQRRRAERHHCQQHPLQVDSRDGQTGF